MSLDAFIASTRFGLGPQMGELAEIESDPKAWLRRQIERAYIPPEIAAFTRNKEGEQALKAFLEIRKKKEPQKKAGLKDLYVRQTAKRFDVQAKSDQPFIERLTMFWSNHFTVSIEKTRVVPVVNQFEGEAIRPHVNGTFADMLIAVTKHPAMLMYLDNAGSVGPNSPGGQRMEKGLNENLGREILELHTLGVDGGYAQEDVIALAKIITGWSISPETGGFAFRERQHEPGPKNLLGKTYTEAGVKEGEQALRDLAAHPSTARHIATKLARHFVADDPPQEAITKLAKKYMETGGNLKALNLMLIDMKECWDNPLSKVKTSYEYVLSACRLTGINFEPIGFVKNMASLDYQVFAAKSPAGYPDTAIANISPDGLVKRIEWAKIFCDRLPARWKPIDLAYEAFGPVLREETKFIINGAASGSDGFAFVLSSPEFQRR